MSYLKKMQVSNQLKGLEIVTKFIVNVPGRGDMLNLYIGKKDSSIEECLLLSTMLDEVDRAKVIDHIKFEDDDENN